MEKQIITLPLIPLRGMTIFPNMVMHFDVGRDKSIAAVEAAMDNRTEIFLSTQKDIEIEEPNIDDIYEIGTICKVKQVLKLPNELTRVLVEGIQVGKIDSVEENNNYIEVVVERIEELGRDDSIELDGNIRLLKKQFKKFIRISEGLKSPMLAAIDEDSVDEEELVYLIASYTMVSNDIKQEFLEELNIIKKIEMLLVFLQKEIEIATVQKKITNKLNKNIDKSQKEYYLREQIKVIQEELGEDDDQKKEIKEYEEKISKTKMPKEIKSRAEYELKRLKASSDSSSESGVIKAYLDWILDLPWSKSTKDNFDIDKAEEVLENDHYGLEDVKTRILEYLAVKEYTNTLKGPILCLVGPPGVGKSSIAKSIAKAINRKFVRISLGGLRDEAEIRGHRKTYVGAIPGRIIYALKEAKSNNPLILLDEIDKLSSDYKGNPADALLEILDNDQNKNFRDNYLELDFDLSKTLFITTANSLDTIPRPLLDRMEIIEVSGYTYEEKFHIAKNHLIKKQLIEHKIEENIIKISDNTIKDIINYYTRESGVRSLERVVAKVIRKAITEMIKTKKETITINAGKLEKYLGPQIFSFDKASLEDKVGVVNGMAWTAYGGDTLPLEVIKMDGTGKLELTGQLGDVMKESAKIAYGYVRANGLGYGVKKDFYKKSDIHIHAPEGAVKKDGPSAGVAMVTALVSSLSDKKIRGDIAMTGEVTLTGKVLPIGGVKEKTLAAHRAGITSIILPKENMKDAIKIPASVKSKLNIHFVEDVKEVLSIALVGDEQNDN